MEVALDARTVNVVDEKTIVLDDAGSLNMGNQLLCKGSGSVAVADLRFL